MPVITDFYNMNTPPSHTRKQRALRITGPSEKRYGSEESKRLIIILRESEYILLQKKQGKQKKINLGN